MPEALIPADSRLIFSRNCSLSTSQQHALQLFTSYITGPYRGYRCLLHNGVSSYKTSRTGSKGILSAHKGLIFLIGRDMSLRRLNGLGESAIPLHAVQSTPALVASWTAVKRGS